MTALIIFHCLPSAPCCDGLLSALLQKKLYLHYRRLYFPYTRSKESFKKLKQAFGVLKSLKQKKEEVVVLYLDVCPLHPEEFEALTDLRSVGVSVQIKDHHPCDDIEFLKERVDDCKIQTEYCASKYVAQELIEAGISLPSWMKEAVEFMQFSDYEGQALALAGQHKFAAIAEKLFEQNRELDSMTDLNGTDKAYYILNAAMPNFYSWKFLLEAEFTTLDHIKATSSKLEKSFDALERRYEGLFEGHLDAVYNKQSLLSALSLRNEAESILNEALEVNIMIEGSYLKIIVCFIGIVKYGRSLELTVRNELQKRSASYAILINPPTETYYLSLRRATPEHDARKLVKVIKELSGTTIGGGHPWASGATLTQAQLELLLQELGAIKLIALLSQ